MKTGPSLLMVTNIRDAPRDARHASLWEAIAAVDKAQTREEKGRAYEILACRALTLISGLRIKHRRLRTSTSEIDIVVEYVGQPRHLIFEEVGRYILAECKNWGKSVGAKELRDFIGKLDGTRTKLGLYFSRNGATESRRRDAVSVIRAKYLQDGLVVVVLTFDDIKAVAQGEDFLQLIDRRYDEVRFQLG